MYLLTNYKVPSTGNYNQLACVQVDFNARDDYRLLGKKHLILVLIKSLPHLDTGEVICKCLGWAVTQVEIYNVIMSKPTVHKYIYKQHSHRI